MILDQYGKPIPSKNTSGIINMGMSAWASAWVNFLGKILNIDEISVKEYERMINVDETVSSGIEYITLSVISRLGEYTHPKKKISKFINQQFERCMVGLNQIAESILTNLWAGFSVGEMGVDFEDGLYQMYDYQPVHPLTVQFQLFKDGKYKNRIEKVYQISANTLAGGLGIELDMNRTVVSTHRGRFQNPYGVSRLKTIYSPFYFKENVLAYYAQALERYGSPTIIITTPNPGEPITDPDGKQTTRLEYLNKVFQYLQNETVITLGGEEKANLLQPPSQIGKDFLDGLLYANKMIYRGILIPSLIGDHDGTGAYALGQTHFDLFVLTLDKTRNELIEVIVDQIIRKLITWNFPGETDFGSFSYREFQPADEKILSETFSNMVNAGVLSKDRFEDISYMRERLGLPGIDRAEFDKTQEEKANKEAEEIKRNEDLVRNNIDNEENNLNKSNKQNQKEEGQKDKKSLIKASKFRGGKRAEPEEIPITQINGLPTVFSAFLEV